MSQGDKSSGTDKAQRPSARVESGSEQKGLSPKSAATRVWATVNKLTGRGRKNGPGRRQAKRPYEGMLE